MCWPTRALYRPVVDTTVLDGDVEQGQVDAGGDQDDERVHGDLADHERPVVREDLVQARCGTVRRAEALVDGVQRLLLELRPLVGCGPLLRGAHPVARCSRSRGRRARCSRSGDHVAVGVARDGQLRQGPGRRAEHRLAVLEHVEGRLVAGADELMDRTLYRLTAQPAWVQILEKATRPLAPETTSKSAWPRRAWIGAPPMLSTTAAEVASFM